MKISPIILASVLLIACRSQSQTLPPKPSAKAKKVILLIGDGMGTAQIFAGLTANKGKLNLERCTFSGFQKTSSSDNYVTDSGAGATAFSIGEKTYNGAIGVDATKVARPTLLEIAEKHGLLPIMKPAE